MRTRVIEFTRIRHLQLADCPTYVKTLHQMHLHYPSMILVPETFFSLSDISLASGGKKPQTTSLLVQCMMEEFEGVPIEPVTRKYWSDSAGDYLQLSQSYVPSL